MLARQVEVAGRPAIEDAAVRQRLNAFIVRAKAIKHMSYRVLTTVSQGEIPGPEGSMVKMEFAHLTQDIANYGLELMGPAAMLAGADAPYAGDFQAAMLENPACASPAAPTRFSAPSSANVCSACRRMRRYRAICHSAICRAVEVGMRRIRWWWLFLAVLLAPTFALAGADHGAGELEVIPLKHRRAEQLLPQLILFVESGGEIAGTGNTLFLRASPKNRAEIHALVDTLDTPPRRLMISVRQEGDDSGEAGGADVSGRVILGGGAPAVRGDARIYQRERQSRRTVSQQVQTLEGARAAIVSGQSLVLPMRQLTVTPTGVVIAQTIVQQELGTGFSAVPYLNGDRVTLEISPSTTPPGACPDR